MPYDIRYRLNNEESSEHVDVETAAEAVEMVRHRVAGPDDTFELIEVQPINIDEGDSHHDDEMSSAN